MTHPAGGTAAQLRLYVSRQADSLWRYVLEQVVQLVAGWIPTVVGIGLRGVLYRLILQTDGWAAIESGVRLAAARSTSGRCDPDRSGRS